jgi:predicted amidophosphoribosyltransferase
MRFIALLLRLSAVLKTAHCVLCKQPLRLAGLCQPCYALLLPPAEPAIQRPLRLTARLHHPVYGASVLTPRVKRYVYGYKFNQRWHYRLVLLGLWQHQLAHLRQQHPTLGQSVKQANIWLTLPPLKQGKPTPLYHLAQRLAAYEGFTFMPHLLQWQTLPQQPQHQTASAQQRLQQLVNTMGVSLTPTAIAPTAIVVVDDLITTGATLAECFRTIEASWLKPIPVLGLGLTHVLLEKPS